ncbi:MAG: 2-hydroxyacyl-CoA dehydratase [Deltaproteobacteria bacterium]|nr:2-hydroxyacyl-CoA dehydratase [Deltaproteobacteria bacterium]
MRDKLYAMPAWRTLLDTIPELIDVLQGDDQGLGLRSLVVETWEYLAEMATQWEQGAPFVWYNLGFNPEMILALDGVGRICIESQAVFQNIIGDPEIAHEFIDLAESAGVPADCCSADKAAIGAISQNLYPEPACTVGINTPCDSQVLATQAMAELTGKPLFVVDVPYYDDDRTIRHVQNQLGELVPFLEEHTGRKFSWDRLQKVCELSNKAVELIWEWLDWRRNVPLTQSSKLVAFTLVHQIIFCGTQSGVKIAESMAREARERHERGERFFEERVRAVWYQDPVWTDMQIYDWMEQELGLTVPVDVFGFYAQEGLIDTSTPETMLYGLARKLVKCQPMSRQFRGNIETYIADFMHMHEAFRADCAIFAGHVACKHAWGGIGLFREACRKAGIPLLVFEFDMFDARITSRDAIQAELERFVNEVVWPMKQRKKKKAAS